MHTTIALYFTHRRNGMHPALAWQLACIHYRARKPCTQRA